MITLLCIVSDTHGLACGGCYQKKDAEDKKLKNVDAKVGSGRIIPLKQVREYCSY